MLLCVHCIFIAPSVYLLFILDYYLLPGVCGSRSDQNNDKHRPVILRGYYTCVILFLSVLLCVIYGQFCVAHTHAHRSYARAFGHTHTSRFASPAKSAAVISCHTNNGKINNCLFFNVAPIVRKGGKPPQSKRNPNNRYIGCVHAGCVLLGRMENEKKKKTKRKHNKTTRPARTECVQNDSHREYAFNCLRSNGEMPFISPASFTVRTSKI